MTAPRRNDPSPPSPPRPAVFVDRDDTLNINHALPPHAFPGTPGDLYLPEHVQLFPGVLDACRRLKAAGYKLIVVTNQAATARGHCSLRDIEATNDRLRDLLVPEPPPPDRTSTSTNNTNPAVPAPFASTLVDAVYAATHHPDAVVDHLRANHHWRKGGPGMLLHAAREHHIDLTASWMIGDKHRDKLAGINAGIPAHRCLRVATGNPAAHNEGDPPDFPDLPAAARHILRDHRETEPTHPPRCVPATTVRLRARGTAPLADDTVRRTVLATARGITERTGIDLIDLTCTDDTITATIATSRLAALGFMAELRRVTNRWHAARHTQPGQTHPADTDTPPELWAAGDLDANDP